MNTATHALVRPLRRVEAGDLAVVLSAAAALSVLPLVSPSGQLVAGVAVNAALVGAALGVRRGVLLWPLAVVPTLALLAAARVPAEGLGLSGLALLCPAIWAGNLLLMAGLRALRGRLGGPGALAACAAGKALVITVGALAAGLAGLLPLSVAVVLGPGQFATALLGGGAALSAAALANRHRA